jgi:DNA-binding response OmpR family regulator
MDSIKVLIVDDDPGIRELIQRYLTEQGLQADSVEDGVNMDRWLENNEADVIVLDLMLPGEDGLSIARRLHAQSTMKILMLSARSDDIDRIIGLEIGADDYLAKPFNPRELLARIRALSRRQQKMENIEQQEQAEYQFGSYYIDVDAHLLFCHEKEVPLTYSEFELLKLLVTHPNRVLSRDFLIDQIQGYERSPYDRSIDVCISRLRKKLGENGNPPCYIETIRGTGYRFNPAGNNHMKPSIN